MASSIERQSNWNDFDVGFPSPAPLSLQRRRPAYSGVYDSQQWFIDQYLAKQTIPTLRSFVTRIEEYTRQSLAVRSQERKADLLAKSASSLRPTADKAESKAHFER